MFSYYCTKNFLKGGFVVENYLRRVSSVQFVFFMIFLTSSFSVFSVSKEGSLNRNESEAKKFFFSLIREGALEDLCTFVDETGLPKEVFAAQFLNSSNKKGRGPLHVAVKHDRGDILEWLLNQKGINVDLLDGQGRTAFYNSSLRKGITCGGIFLDFDFDVDRFFIPNFPNPDVGELMEPFVVLAPKVGVGELDSRLEGTLSATFRSNLPFSYYGGKKRSRDVVRPGEEERFIQLPETEYRSVDSVVSLPLSYKSLCEATHDTFHLKHAKKPRFFVTMLKWTEKGYEETMCAFPGGSVQELGFDEIRDARVTISVSHGEDFSPYLEKLPDEKLAGGGDADLDFNSVRKLRIFSWGKNDPSQTDPNCDLTFDVRKFYAQYDDAGIRKEDGRNPVIKGSIRSHRDFGRMMRTVVSLVEERNARTVSFMCAWGKHRSVALAELLKKEFYPKSKVTHLKFPKKK